jgi:hypothetical protein
MSKTVMPPPRAVPLTRRHVELILVGHMGWDDIDVKTFWSIARQIQWRGAL